LPAGLKSLRVAGEATAERRNIAALVEESLTKTIQDPKERQERMKMWRDALKPPKWWPVRVVRAVAEYLLALARIFPWRWGGWQ
jgi:hypothetical protein